MLAIGVGSFVLKHSGNRALAAFMHALGEVTMHIGLFELAVSGAVLLADGGPLHDNGGRSSSSHGDGDTTVRSLSSEEDQAVRWKYRFPHAGPEAVRNVLRALPEWCIKDIVEAYRTKGPEKELAERTAIIAPGLLPGGQAHASKALHCLQ